MCNADSCLDVPCCVGLVLNMSASHAVGRWFASQPGHIKDHHKNGTNCLPALHACIRVAVQPNCLKGRVVCGIVYGNMHLKISWDQSQEWGIVSVTRII